MVFAGTSTGIAPAKLTKWLKVGELGRDGLHAIESEMVSVSLVDRITVTEGTGMDLLDPFGVVAERLAASGPFPVDGSNLVNRAIDLFGIDAHVELEKSIPISAGLGGGSSDAACMFRLLGRPDSVELAMKLGSDIPFCLKGGRAIVSGYGEKVEQLDYVDEQFALLLVPVAISTKLVYETFDRVGGEGQNHLLKSALECSAELAAVYDEVSELVGIRPHLAGSGSTLFYELDVVDWDDLTAGLLARHHRTAPGWFQFEASGLTVTLVRVNTLPPEVEA